MDVGRNLAGLSLHELQNILDSLEANIYAEEREAKRLRVLKFHKSKPSRAPDAEQQTGESAQCRVQHVEAEVNTLRSECIQAEAELQHLQRLAAVDEDPLSDGDESWTTRNSEDDRMDAEIHVLESVPVLRASVQVGARSSPRRSSSRSFQTAADSADGDAEAGGSCGSRGSFRTASECDACFASSRDGSRSPAGNEGFGTCPTASQELRQTRASAPAAVATSQGQDQEGAAQETRSCSVKGKGKGKGKAKGCAPKMPPQGFRGPRASVANAEGGPKTSSLLQIQWKVLQGPAAAAASTNGPKNGDDEYLRKLDDLGPFLASAKNSGAQFCLQLQVPTWPETVFAPVPDFCGPSPPQARQVVKHYFQKNTLPPAWKPQSGTNAKSDERSSAALLDDTRRQMLGLMLSKFKMEYARRQEKELAEKEPEGEPAVEPIEKEPFMHVLSIKRAVLACDEEVVKLEGLVTLRDVMRIHEQDGRKVCEFVKKRGGPQALNAQESPEEHRLVYEVSKVPQVNERLECMIFRVSYRECVVAYKENLLKINNVLNMLSFKRHVIGRFFATAHCLGQSLKGKIMRGFQLAVLESLPRTKLTKDPKITLLHFVLALMSKDDADALFDDADLVLLRGAKALRTDKVIQDAIELAKGLYGVEEICQSGMYTCPATGQAVKIEKRRKTLPPQSVDIVDDAASTIDNDDQFHKVMQEFVDANIADAKDLLEMCLDTMALYKELAVFFDDMSVYPPPKNDGDEKKRDLCDVFRKFAEDVKRCRQEVDNDCLRQIVASNLVEEAELTPRPSPIARAVAGG